MVKYHNLFLDLKPMDKKTKDGQNNKHKASQNLRKQILKRFAANGQDEEETESEDDDASSEENSQTKRERLRMEIIRRRSLLDKNATFDLQKD